MKIVFTASGEKYIAEYKEAQAQLLIDQIASRKYVFGDDIIEITAADIKEALEGQRYQKLSYIRRSPLRTFSQLYIVLGFMILMGSLFYENLMSLLNKNPNQLMFFAFGSVILLVGLFFNMRAKERDREFARMEEIERLEYMEKEKFKDMKK